MSTRVNFYFRQKVAESELDDAFDYAEQADQAIVIDNALVGVNAGLVVAQRGAGPNLTVDVSAGSAANKDGQRMATSVTTNVNVASDESSVSTTVTGAGNSKIISVFMKFRRVLTDPRTDGNSATVYFLESEGVEFIVRQGAEAVTPAPPPLDGEHILLADITRTFGQTTITNADISIARREDVIVAAGSPRALRRGTALAALTDLLGWLNGHLTGASDRHVATAVDVAIASTWADASSIVGTDVDAALEEIVSDLAATTGAGRVGAAASAASAMFGLAAGSVGTQLAAIKGYLDLGPRGSLVTSVNAAASPYTYVAANVRDLLVDTSAGAVNIQLPAPAMGLRFKVKDATGNFSTNACTLTPNGAENIEGLAAARVLTAAWGAYEVFSDGTDWFLA